MEIIAERRLTVDCGIHTLEATARLGKPTLSESGEDWFCPYEVQVGEWCKTFRLHGVDSMQALVLALKTLDVELEARAKEIGGQLLWFDEPFRSMLG
ncbi:MAG TPA: hypothetical protein VFY81_00480 [Gammaproteobacteria bacterium]|nr:hypothetical protein [Gammaproteobacteria bacterium]